MGMEVGHIAAAVARAQARMHVAEQELNAADAKLGDGDTGGMLVRVLDRMAGEDVAAAPDVGAAFQQLARAAAAATGSSLGTLVATGLMAAARRTKGEQSVPWSALSEILGEAREAMGTRGGAALGDKTVLDGLDAVSGATAGLDDPRRIGAAAVAATRDALERFRGEPCKIGRARMFAEKSIGHDDPGMLALTRVVEAVAPDEGVKRRPS